MPNVFERFAARFGIAGDRHDAELPEFRLPEPLPAWKTSPWALAIADGNKELMIRLFRDGMPIPPEIMTILAAALSGEPTLPFRIEVVQNPAPGKKHPGRPFERHTLRDLSLASRMSLKMKNGVPYDAAALAVADESGIGDRSVKAAYSRFKVAIPEMEAFQAEFTDRLRRLEDQQPSPEEKQPPLGLSDDHQRQ